MGGYKDSDLGDRLSAADKAKKALLDRFKAKTSPDDPEVAKRAAERKAVHDARIARETQRATEKKAAAEAAAERQRMDAEAKVKADQEDIERKARELRETADREVELEAARKAERDARYAARKARGKKK